MNTFDQFVRLGIAVYVDYKKRGLSDYDAEERALIEVVEISKNFKLVPVCNSPYTNGSKRHDDLIEVEIKK